MIEELHRPLKSAIKCHATERWTEVLPIILLGLRTSLKEDILCTPAELVFGTTIRLPGEMFDSSKPDDDVVNFVSKLKSHMQSLHPKPPKHHSKRPVFIHPGLLEATHVFLRRDMLRRPLQQPYDGPFKVLQRKDKVFFLDINGKRVSVSIDRCKPAFFLNTEDLQLPQTKNETPSTVEPNATASTPATVESDPTASTPTQPSTRSGRKVHLPTRNSNLGHHTGQANAVRGINADQIRESPHPWRQTKKGAKPEQDGAKRKRQWWQGNIAGLGGCIMKIYCSQLASLDKNNALREIKLRWSYLQGKSTTMSVIAHQTEKEWISANKKSRQRMSQTQAEGAAEQHADRLEDAHLRAHHSCFTTSERDVNQK
ncbi:integrase catalytic domain-containing protein [Trichonephila clavipes]|nr:integrase catalytic domain-containing protein [Trichonephila clavipes]